MQRLAHPRTQLWLVLCSALIIRLAAACWWQSRLPEDQPFGFGDSDSYWVLAQTIAQGEPYQYGGQDARVFRTPGYPLVLSGLFILFGDDPHVLWARALGAVLGTLVVGEVIWLACILFNKTTGIVAGILATLYPGAIAMSTFVLSEAAFCPLMLLQLIIWVLAWNTDAPRRRAGLGLLAGVLAAAAALCRPAWLPLTPLAVVATILLSRQRKQHACLGLCLLAGLVIGMAPWWLRNYTVTNRWVLTSLQAGAGLYDGWNPRATGGSDLSFVDTFRETQLAEDTARIVPPEDTFEYRLDRRMHNTAVAWARENPRRVLQLAAIKLVRMWNIWPNERQFQSVWVRLLMTVTYLPLLVCGLWGAVRCWRGGWPYQVCLLPAVYVTLLHMVFISSIRYRQPAMLTILVLAAGVIASRNMGNETQEQTN